jgi:hypothetical protein
VIQRDFDETLNRIIDEFADTQDKGNFIFELNMLLMETTHFVDRKYMNMIAKIVESYKPKSSDVVPEFGGKNL